MGISDMVTVDMVVGDLVKLAQKYFEMGYQKAVSEQRERDDAAPRRTFDLSKVPIEDLELPTRIHNCLKREGYRTVAEVLELTDEYLLGIRNFDPDKSIAQLDAILDEVGLRRTCRQ